MSHFFCRDCKDRQYLDHDINDYFCHSHSGFDANVYLKPTEETFDAVKNVNKFVLTGFGVFYCLGSMGVKIGRIKET
jgi:hypothetical protein